MTENKRRLNDEQSKIKDTVQKALRERRSCRSFTEEEIDDEILMDIMKTGQYAPSGMNMQDYQITLIKDKEIRQDVLNALKDELKDLSYDGFYGAPYYILISAPKENGNGLADTSCVALNIMHSASIYNIGTVWVNQFKGLCEDETHVRDALNKAKVPADHDVLNAIALGYSDEEIHGDREIKSKLVVI